VLIVGARVLDVSRGRYLAPAAILIEDGRVKSVTPEPPASMPEATVRVESEGGVLVSGLIDAHAWAAPTADLDADYFYLMGLAHGVTGYRTLNVRTGWGVAQRGRALSGATLAPRLWTSGRGINQGASPGRWLFDAQDGSAAAEEAAQQVASKVDWIAGYDALGADIYKAIVAAVRKSPVRVSGQPGAASMSDLVAAGVSSIETLAYPLKPSNGSPDDAWLAAGAKELATLQARLLRGRVTLVPMMAAAMTRAWTSQAAFLKRFVRAGGRVAAGTGFELRGYPVPGVGLHQELAALVRAGLTPAEALRAATVTVAELVGAKAGFAPGTEANFIVVSGDPLKRIEDLGNITNVVRAGEVLDVKALLARAKQAAAPRGLPSAALPSTTLGAGRAEKPPGSISQKRPGLQTGHDPEHR
jgi:imidazolonepropionase-like amidohydrolase